MFISIKQMDKGFIILHRKILDNAITSYPGLLEMFVTLLMLAGFEDKTILWNGQEVTLKRGQFITGRFVLAKQLRVKPSTVYKRLKLLEKLQIITTESNNKYTIVTIVKYGQYQDITKKGNTQSNNQVTTKEQQSSTTNTLNNVNNDNNNTGATPPSTALTVKDEFFENQENQAKVIEWLVSKGVEEALARRELAKFIGYWTEPNSKGKQRWQNEKFFEVRRRIATWFSRVADNTKPQGRTRKVIKL